MHQELCTQHFTIHVCLENYPELYFGKINLAYTVLCKSNHGNIKYKA